VAYQSCGIHYWHARTVQSVGQRMADQVQVDRPNPGLPAQLPERI
jgi:hypothetical protein